MKKQIKPKGKKNTPIEAKMPFLFGNTRDPKLVYFEDFGRLLIEKVDEAIEDSREYQFGCARCGVLEQESICKCIQYKRDRDNKEASFMTTGQMDLEIACEIVMETANKTIEALSNKSFCCSCYPAEIEKKLEEEVERLHNLALAERARQIRVKKKNTSGEK